MPQRNERENRESTVVRWREANAHFGGAVAAREPGGARAGVGGEPPRAMAADHRAARVMRGRNAR